MRMALPFPNHLAAYEPPKVSSWLGDGMYFS